MDLPISTHNIEVKLNTIRKHIQYAIDDLPMKNSTSGKTLEQLLDRMDKGTNDPKSVVPNREAGDLSCGEELQYLSSIRLNINQGNNYV